MTHDLRPTIAIEGWVALWDSPDASRDVFKANSLKPTTKPVTTTHPPLNAETLVLPMFYNHDIFFPIGYWEKFENRTKGFFGMGKIDVKAFRNAFKRTGCADIYLRLVLAKNFSGLSIGFQTIKAVKTQGLRFIDEAELYEASLVSRPKQSLAHITSATPSPLPVSRPAHSNLNAGLNSAQDSNLNSAQEKCNDN